MACALTTNYTYLGCKGGLSSLDEVRFTEFANMTSIALTANVITTITMASTTKFRKYVLDKDMGMDSDDLTFNQANGPLSYAHKVDMTIKGMTTVMKQEIKLLAKNTLIIITKRRDGSYWLFGYTKGMDLMTATSGTSKEAVGFTGHNISFAGLEPDFALEVDSSIIAGVTA